MSNSTQLQPKLPDTGSAWEEQMLDDIEATKEDTELHDPFEAGRRHINRMMRLLNEDEGINEDPGI